ncbi:MAG: hypothetical protein GEV06_05655 [Luteitalea sp.]|nr:hypothetical protein [Luteitalea sp.]
MRRTITVAHAGASTYRVTVQEDGERTEHEVTITPEHVQRYAPGTTTKRLLETSFEFLLDREPKEAILTQFELPVIERYFPDYPRKIREMV